MSNLCARHASLIDKLLSKEYCWACEIAEQQKDLRDMRALLKRAADTLQDMEVEIRRKLEREL